MTVSSGRCHGPGCTQTAVVEFWCSEACQAAWDRQLAEADAPRSVGTFRLHDVSFVGQPLTSEWTVRVAIDGHLSEDSARTFADAADRAAEMVGEVTAEPNPQATYSGTASSVMEDILRAYQHIEQMSPPEPVKLTRGQWEALRAANPPLMPGYGVGDALGVLSGVPIELVEDERDSTLYRAPVEAVGVFEAFDEPPTFGPLPLAVEGDSEERVCEPSAPDLSRGWLDRTLDRLFGRTT